MEERIEDHNTLPYKRVPFARVYGAYVLPIL